MLNVIVSPYRVTYDVLACSACSCRLHDELQEEIDALDEIRASTPAGHLVVAKARLFMTMIDQKVLNNIMDIPMHSCGMCGAQPADFMQACNYDSQLFQPYPDALNFGISPLHAWINFTNHLMKLSCHQPFLSNRACGEVNKQLCRAKKEEIHRKMFERIGIKVGPMRQKRLLTRVQYYLPCTGQKRLPCK